MPAESVKKLLPSRELIFFFLTLACGFLLLGYQVDFQPFLSQGDHGRDLYAFAQTMQGAQPYRDYWWVYGPLLPYYYGFFFQWLGVQLPSILVGKLFFNLASGLFFYLALSTLLAPFTAFLGALWFWSFPADFFFTYNHAGGIPFLLVMIYCLFLYLKNPRPLYLVWGMLSAFILCFIKINIGLANLAVLVISVFLIDRANKNPGAPFRKIFYLFSLVLIPLLVFLIYAGLLKDLTVYEIRQCLPYLPGDQPHTVSLWTAARIFYFSIIDNMRFTWPNLILGFTILLCALRAASLLSRNLVGPTTKNRALLAIGILLLFFAANLHEFLISGVYYRSFWVKPVEVLLIAVIVSLAVQTLPKLIKTLLAVSILFTVFMQYAAVETLLAGMKTPDHYVETDGIKAYLGNSPQWTRTVQETTRYLKTHLKKDEAFFAIPYDPIYYYLTQKTSPTRQLIFFDHINIPPEQEIKVIEELEKKKVDYLVLSNRIVSGEPGLGVFGESYGRRLAGYFKNYFDIAVVYGDWQNDPGWAWNYGTMILKRKTY